MIHMSDTIWVALISLVSSIAVALVSYQANRKGAREAAQSNAELLDYRLQKLEEKVSKHNNLIERTFILEGRVNVTEHDIQELKAKVG